MKDDPRYIGLDGQLCFSLYSASIAVQRLYKPLLDRAGITYTQFIVLCALWEAGTLPVSAIAGRLSLEPSTVTPATKRLEAAGLVKRERSHEDERQMLVSVTDAGAALQSGAAGLTDRLLENSGLDPAGMNELNAAVRVLTQHLRAAP